MYSHSFDVAIIALMIGVESKYTPSILKELGLGAMLHDIGKLLIPKELLQKKTSLTNKEKSLLRRHCELGKDSVAGCSLSQISTNIILQHHERLNRSGYPNHLNALEITEYAKIVMVADSFDVLTAGRPYKKTKDSMEAISYLKKKNSGFDLHYVELLESILN
jgi:HD-GYP domain-containing protein (c-di-GMP phosphodiesterase class II)